MGISQICCYIYRGNELLGKIVKKEKGFSCPASGCSSSSETKPHFAEPKSLNRHLRNQHNEHAWSAISNPKKNDISIAKTAKELTNIPLTVRNQGEPEKTVLEHSEKDHQSEKRVPEFSNDPYEESAEGRRKKRRILTRKDNEVSFEETGNVGGTSTSTEGVTDTQQEINEVSNADLDSNILEADNLQMDMDEKLYLGDFAAVSHASNAAVSVPVAGTDILKEYGLKLVLGRVLQCCRSLFLSSEVASHWKNTHASKSLLLRNGTMEEMCNRLSVFLDTYPDFSQSRQNFHDYLSSTSHNTPFEDIPEHDGYQCLACSTIRTSVDSLRKHTCTCQHQPRLEFKEVRCQKIWNTNIAGLGNYISINPTAPCNVNREDNAQLETLHQFFDTPWFSQPSHPPDGLSLHQRDVSAFLKDIGFIQRMSCISTQKIINTVSPNPPPPFFVALRQLAMAYLESSQCQLQSAALNSPSILTRLERCGAGKLVSDKLRLLNEPTVRTYALSLTRLVSFALLLSNNYQLATELRVVLTSDQKQRLENLSAELGSQTDCQEVTEWEKGVQNHDYPLAVFEEEGDLSDSESDIDDNAAQMEAHMDNHNIRTDKSVTRANPSLSKFHHAVYSICTNTSNTFGDTPLVHVIPTYVIFSSVQADGKIKSCKRQTPPNATLKHIMKATFLHQMFDHALSDGRQHIANCDWESVSNHFMGNFVTPYAWLSDAQSKLTRHALNDPNLGRLAWDSQGDTLLYEETSISMGRFNGFIDHLISSLHKLLQPLLLGIDIQTLSPSLSGYRDKVQNQEMNYNFLHNTYNQHYPFPLQSKIINDTNYFQQRIQGELRVLSSVHQGITTYLTAARKFIIHLLVTLYFTMGMPMRVTELLSIAVRNTHAQMRDLYVIADEMVIQGLYCKTKNVTGKPGRGLRLVPPSVARIIQVYLKDIAPLVYTLMKTTYPSVFERGCKGNANHPYYTHLFVADGDFLSPYTVYTTIKSLSMEHFKTALGISDWRHILKAIGKKYVHLPPPSNPILHKQANHSVSVANRYYAIQQTGILGIHEEEMEHYFHLSKYWQAMWGLRDKKKLPAPPSLKFIKGVLRHFSAPGDIDMVLESPAVFYDTPMPIWRKTRPTIEASKSAYDLLTKFKDGRVILLNMDASCSD